MWVEKIILRTLTVDGLVILLVRMWVEKDMQMISPFTYTSSSLWGCELKSERSCIRDYRNGHPPCEDVSWKIVWSCKTLQNYSHPPCEDVSWKVLGPLLFMLVHRHPPCEDVSWKSLCLTFLSRFHWSSSLWGCELKILSLRHDSSRLCHPPCEDVSWKVMYDATLTHKTVILLVRMWVENLNRFCSRILSIVIFLVRMWVENVGNQNLRNGRCHPPCEDVSWKGCECEYCDDENVILLVRMWVEKMAGWFLFPLSIRHPPCEDVSWKINWCAFPRGGACHPPCEDVSWKINWCAFPRGGACHPPCEDVSWKNYIVYLQTKGFVILHVRMWVEKFYHVTL